MVEKRLWPLTTEYCKSIHPHLRAETSYWATRDSFPKGFSIQEDEKENEVECRTFSKLLEQNLWHSKSHKATHVTLSFRF